MSDKAKYASEAGHAVNADHADLATNAEKAKYASEAGHAVNADHADVATNAEEARHATEADHAVNADTAGTALHVAAGSVGSDAIGVFDGVECEDAVGYQPFAVQDQFSYILLPPATAEAPAKGFLTDDGAAQGTRHYYLEVPRSGLYFLDLRVEWTVPYRQYTDSQGVVHHEPSWSSELDLALCARPRSLVTSSLASQLGSSGADRHLLSSSAGPDVWGQPWAADLTYYETYDNSAQVSRKAAFGQKTLKVNRTRAPDGMPRASDLVLCVINHLHGSPADPALVGLNLLAYWLRPTLVS